MRNKYSKCICKIVILKYIQTKKQPKPKGIKNMEITIESPTRIKMIPETEHEKESLEALWKIIIRCDEDSKVLCPIGAYIASKDDGASFAIQDQ